MFYTIQGEGPDAGRPAVFIRLARCNLRCYFCDTDFDGGTRVSLEDLGMRITAIRGKAELVVITGGEPLLQDITPLTAGCNTLGLEVAIETAGTILPDGFEDWFSPYDYSRHNRIVCSPKTPTLARGMEHLIHSYKYVVSTGNTAPGDGLPVGYTQTKEPRASFMKALARPPEGFPNRSIFLSPMDECDDAKNAANLAHARDLSMKFGYRLSVQLHKLAGIP